MSQVSQLKLYKTESHPCSYIDEMEASTLFVDPAAAIDQNTHTYLSERGFRRSGSILYKPDCMRCQACISIRIPVNQYRFSRNEKRILKRNADLEIFETDNIQHDEFYSLYAAYITQRHSDGDMFPPDRGQFESFFNNPFNTTHFIVFKQQQQIKAVAIIDELSNALSAVYTFYDPDDEHRSLGTMAVLWQIQHAQKRSMDFVYLGYWVKPCAKMSYKARFQPAEIYLNKRWIPLISSNP